MLSPQATPPSIIDPLILWLIVVVADALFAGLPVLGSALGLPLALVRRAAMWFDYKLNREQRSEANRLLRGALMVCVMALAAWTVGWFLASIARSLPHGWIIEAAVIAGLILQRRMIDPVRRIARALASQDIDAARVALSRIVSYDSAGLDAHAVARGAVEAGAARFQTGVIAAAFWYLLLGLPGLCVSRTVNVIADCIGDASPRHAAFGLAAARLDEVLGLLPALLAGLTVVAASAFVPSASAAASYSVWSRSLRQPGVLIKGRAEGAMAGALGLALSSPRRPTGAGIGDGWIGDGKARIGATDVVRAVLLLMVACMIAATFLAAIVVARGL